MACESQPPAGLCKTESVQVDSNELPELAPASSFSFNSSECKKPNLHRLSLSGYDEHGRSEHRTSKVSPTWKSMINIEMGHISCWKRDRDVKHAWHWHFKIKAKNLSRHEKAMEFGAASAITQ
ncbi:hypothetical protein H6P81_003727 [Aristolochia fimbriata]|uniref:Uncharacterized protein n=1 Tax=Aristolochia fimbriata TaxID=158543 RepID=A0AAV7FFD3_ARIFI|nr:hypothetical protein H6P81_003727 [Aristolochia fimbriata]